MHTPPNVPLPDSRPSTPDEDWIIVGAHTEERSPQFTDDNTSSGQFANASADGTLASPIDNNNNNNNKNINTVAHKPPSNISTETPGTDDTTATVTDLRRAAPSAAPTRCTPGLGHLELTSSNMAVFQRELEQRHTDSLAGWAANAGMGSRRLVGKPSSSSHRSSSVGYGSVLTVGGHSMGSGSSIGGGGVGDWAPVQPPRRGDEDVNATGAWCYETTIPL
jgi:hypothetical protein